MLSSYGIEERAQLPPAAPACERAPHRAAQVSRYRVGEQYSWHVDDDPSGDDSSGGDGGGGPALGRVATALVYLNNVAVGGETVWSHRSSDYDPLGRDTAAARASFHAACRPRCAR
eukprot:SAG11_NODE_1858_length_4159_cov_22.716256_4_plen_116_part_00